MILICSRREDEASKVIVNKLRAGSAKVNQLYLDDFASNLHPEFIWNGDVLKNKIGIDLDKIKAIYYRLLFYPYLPNLKMEAKFRDFLNRELATVWFGQLLGMRDDVYWMNHPFHCHLADYKLLQIKTAKEVGFKIPSTCVSTDPDVLFDFYSLLRSGGHDVVSKAIHSGYIEGENESDEEYVLTQKVKVTSSEDIPHGLPLLFQQYVNPEYEIRCFVVGGTVLSVRVISDVEYEDYRIVTNKNLHVEAISMPESIQESCRAITKQFKLNYSAIDLLYRDGMYFFIDFNPIGKWSWFEEKATISVSDIIVEHLLSAAV